MNSYVSTTGFCFSLCLLIMGCAPSPIETTTEKAVLTDENPPPQVVTENAATLDESAEQATVTLSIADLEGLNARIASFSGRVVVVDIWSTSCLPCMREFPNLVALAAKYPDQLVCISFNVDYIGIKSKPVDSYVSKVQEFLQKQQADSVTNLISSTPDSDVLTALEAESIPAILIFGPDGELAFKLTDANTGDDGLTYTGDVIPRVEQLLSTVR